MEDVDTPRRGVAFYAAGCTLGLFRHGTWHFSGGFPRATAPMRFAVDMGIQWHRTDTIRAVVPNMRCICQWALYPAERLLEEDLRSLWRERAYCLVAWRQQTPE